jgi:hypothetical protein
MSVYTYMPFTKVLSLIDISCQRYLPKNNFLYRLLHKKNHALRNQHLVGATHRMYRNGNVISTYNACVRI